MKPISLLVGNAGMVEWGSLQLAKLLYEKPVYVSIFSAILHQCSCSVGDQTIGLSALDIGFHLVSAHTACRCGLDATQDIYLPTYSQFPQERMPTYQMMFK